MASKTASTRKTSSRSTSSRKTSRSTARKTTSARKSDGVKQTAATAGDNVQPSAVNQIASDAARNSASLAGGGVEVAKLHPDVEKVILGDPDTPITSINSVPKAEGGMPADVVATIRSSLDTVRGAEALGQPGQKGHGVGTGTAGLAGTMTPEEAEADDREYRKRIGATK